MKRILTIAAVSFLCFAATTNSVHAAKKAMTGDGHVVILNDNGTWAYADPNDAPIFSTPLEISERTFERSKEANFLVESALNTSAYWLDPTKWSFEKSEVGASSEYSFDFKAGDIYGMVITEEIPIPLNSLLEVAFGYFADVDPYAKVIKKEYRHVNGLKVAYMETSVDVSGMPIVYIGYYYQNAQGTTQLITYTGAGQIEKYRAEMETFLNGFVIR